MTLRVARHSMDLKKIKTFYISILGLDQLGFFKSHESYDGIFIGKEGQDWHLEFTISDHPPIHYPDEDDLLVFYIDTKAEYLEILSRFEIAGIKKEIAKNPYWNKNGVLFKDPDGFGIVLRLKEKEHLNNP